jgi:hypothetical protein
LSTRSCRRKAAFSIAGMPVTSLPGAGPSRTGSPSRARIPP